MYVWCFILIVCNKLLSEPHIFLSIFTCTRRYIRYKYAALYKLCWTANINIRQKPIRRDSNLWTLTLINNIYKHVWVCVIWKSLINALSAPLTNTHTNFPPHMYCIYSLYRLFSNYKHIHYTYILGTHHKQVIFYKYKCTTT